MNVLKLFIFLCIFLCGKSFLFSAYQMPNVVLITIDGASRDTFYALIQKGALPNISTLIEDGNYRNMILNGAPEVPYSIATLMSGITVSSNRHLKDIENRSIINRIKEDKPSIQAATIITGSESLLKQFDPVKKRIDFYNVESERSSSEIVTQMTTYLNTAVSPFFLYVNFPEPGLMAQKYREGAEVYSSSIRRVDKAMAGLKEILSETDTPTLIIITSLYGFQRHSREMDTSIWVAANRKTLFKGKITDITRSIYQALQLDIYAVEPPILGTPLFQNR